MGIGSIKPEVLSLREFFKQEASGLRVPSIQRQWVWDAEDVKQLIYSIMNGYPIGAVIIWEPASKFPSAPLVGKDSRHKVARYVLDGQQRLTALMLVKNGWSLTRGSKEIITTPISFVPENSALYFSKSKGIDISLVVNATLGDAESLTKLQRDYPLSYRKAMDSVGEKIVNYQLPFYVLKSDQKSGDDEYEKIAEIFTLVNSAGVKIGNLEMFLSFFAAAFPKEEKERIIAIHDEFSKDFELDLEPLVRFVFSRLGLTQNQITKTASFKRSIQDLKDRYSKDKKIINETLDHSYEAIQAVMDLLETELGLAGTQFLPSQNVLLPLFDEAYGRRYKTVSSIPTLERRRMLKWLLLASFYGIYSSSPNYKIENDLETVRGGTKGFPLEKLLTAMRNRPPRQNRMVKSDIVDAYSNVLRGRSGQGYLMLMSVLLHRNKATDWAGKSLHSESAAIHHIFPREYLRDSGETREEYVNSLANLAYISPAVNSEIGDTPPAEYLRQYEAEILEQHFVPTDRRLWEFDNFEQFLKARLQLIWKGTSKLVDSFEEST